MFREIQEETSKVLLVYKNETSTGAILAVLPVYHTKTGAEKARFRAGMPGLGLNCSEC